jgi:aspartate carbamoyltransferase catalytic subunit
MSGSEMTELELGFRGHRHLLYMDQFSRDDIDTINLIAKRMREFCKEGGKLSFLQARIVQPVFFEQSSRTLKRHESASTVLSADILSPHDTERSSMSKGESDLQTIITYAQSSDILVIRHPEPYSVEKFAKEIDKLENNTARVISGGDGDHEHPTQAFVDYHTVYEELGTLENLTWIMVGDLENGRPVHSHMKGIPKFSNTKIVGFPVGGLGLTDEYKTNSYEEHDYRHLKEFICSMDPRSKAILYLTRVQFERIAKKRYPDYDTFDKLKKAQIRDEIYNEIQYQIGFDIIDLPNISIVLHPLPAGSELTYEVLVSGNPKVVPIEQMKYGVSATAAYMTAFSGLENEVKNNFERYIVSRPVKFKHFN